MRAHEREELERRIHEPWERGDLDRAASVALEGYGPEIFGFLLAFHRSEEDASEVFSRCTELLWRGLGSFAWQCSFRTWLYTIARNASMTYRHEQRRHAKVCVPLPGASEVSAIEQRVRTETLSFLRTERKTKMAQLREALPLDDQVLLVLRVDKDLAWNDLARVMHEQDAEPLTEEALKKEAARLRKRLQLIKQKLLEMARRDGFFSSPDKDG